jgi:hypothetical protein
MTAFDINHDNYLDLNEQLLRAVERVGQLLEQVNTVMASTPAGVWGAALPIIQEDQKLWNGAYTELLDEINRTTVASINIHDIFKEGDHRGTRIMLG